MYRHSSLTNATDFRWTNAIRHLKTAVQPTIKSSVLLALLIAPPCVVADDLEIVALASSDWWYHGTTETGGNPAIGFALDWEISDRVFAGIEAHQAEVDGPAQRHRSFLFYAGTGAPLTDDWYLSGIVSHREFPGSGREWDSTEFSVALDHIKGWTVSLDYSPNYYEHKTQAWITELGYRRDLGERFFAYASIGAVTLTSSRFTDYRFARVGGGVRWRRAVLDVSYRANSEGDSESFGAAALSDPRVVGQLTWRIR